MKAMNRTAALVFLTAGVLLAAPAAAQRGDAGAPLLAEFDARQANGQCPSTQDIEARNNLGPGTADTGLALGIVADPSAKMFQNSALASAVWEQRPQLFSVVDVLSISETRALIRWQGDGTGPRRCAWIELAHLVRHDNMVTAVQARRGRGPGGRGGLRDLLYARIGPRPLLVSELRARAADNTWAEPANYDPQNTLVAKAILSNLNTDTDGVPARTTPFSDDAHQQLVLGKPYVVFDVRVGKPRGGGHFYYLLGESGNEEVATPDVTILGWVHEDDLLIWSTRMAASWRGSPPFLGWRRREDAVMRQGPSSAEPVRFETAGNLPVVFPPRPDAQGIADAGFDPFPILQVWPPIDKVQDKVNDLRQQRARGSRSGGGLSRVEVSRQVDAYRVAIPFGYCDRDNAQDCIGPSEYNRRVQESAAAREKLRTVDILFLIDNTRSMEKYFASSAQALSEFLRHDVRTTGGPNSIHVGAATYADYIAGTTEGTPDRVIFNVVRPIGEVGIGAGANAIDAALRNQSVQQPGADPFNDEWEAPFAALIRAANDHRVRWRAGSGLRLIIHVADHGNREGPLTQSARLVERVTREMVLDALGRARISYVPIQVEGEVRSGSNESGRRAREDFLQQASAFAAQRGLLVDGFDPVIRTTRAQAEQEADRVRAVREALNRSLAIFEGFRREDSTLSYCNNLSRERREANPVCKDAVRSLPATAAARTIARLTLEAGYNERQIANTERRRANVVYVWVRPVETIGGREVDRLDYWAAMEGTAAVNRTQEAMRILCDVFRRSEEMQMANELDEAKKKLAQLFVRAQVAEDQALATLLRVPFWERQEVLSLPPHALLQGIQRKDREQLQQWRRGFCVSAHLLEHVRYNRLPIALPQIRETPTEVTSPPDATREPFVWSRNETTSRQAPVYYVPYNYFPTDRFPPE
jgi:hypothetical protein